VAVCLPLVYFLTTMVDVSKHPLRPLFPLPPLVLPVSTTAAHGGRSFADGLLQVVNFLNSGDRRLGNAPGFKLDALLKLADTKSPVNRKYTLLHYVVEHCNEAKPGSVEAASRAVACCEQAFSYPFDMVDGDLKKLTKDLKEVETVRQSHY
jgi:hypothetical protein